MSGNALQVEQRIAVSVVEAAKLAGLGRSTLYEAIGAGGLASIRVGGRRLVAIADLKAWLDAHRVVGGA